MTFKYETKNQYTTIWLLEDHLNAHLAEKLSVQIRQLVQEGSCNFLVELNPNAQVDDLFVEKMITIGSECYEQAHSFVLSQANKSFIEIVKSLDAIDALNYAPTSQEAIDIISMEILERDLMNED
jgi:hypothetical protein